MSLDLCLHIYKNLDMTGLHLVLGSSRRLSYVCVVRLINTVGLDIWKTYLKSAVSFFSIWYYKTKILKHFYPILCVWSIVTCLVTSPLCRLKGLPERQRTPCIPYAYVVNIGTLLVTHFPSLSPTPHHPLSIFQSLHLNKERMVILIWSLHFC